MYIWAHHLQNLTDARYFAAANADYLSFKLDPSAEDCIAINVVEGIRGWVDGPKIVGCFGLSQSIEQVLEVVALLRLDAVCVPLGYPKDLLNGIKVFIEIEQDEKNILQIEPYLGLVCGILVHSATNEHIIKVLDELSEFTQIWLCSDFQPEDIGILQATAIHGIVLKGGDEERVGLKDFDALDSILELLEA